jgi:4-amino-4-deoxy-L-arabinose transferase-like glycosyltransferase
MLWRLWRHLQTIERRLFVLVSLYLLGLVGFYGFYFGAGHFLPRYLFPLSPFLALLWASLVV